MKLKRAELKNSRTNRWSKKHDYVKWVGSDKVKNIWVQDKSENMVIIGSDCVSLYPNLTKTETASEVAEAIMESSIKWADVNYKEGVRFLVLGRPKEWQKTSGLSRVLPSRRYVKGCKPGLTGAGPLGASSNDEVQWVFRKVELTMLEKRRILAEVMRLSVELMFETHCYSFGGKIYRQTEGGPIGLRSTCAVARVVMSRWDQKLKQRMVDSNISSEADGRYVDDGRLILYPIRSGWRWHRGGLWFRADWEEEDLSLSCIERTKRG